MSSLLFLHHLFPHYPPSSVKTHLRSQTSRIPPFGQPNTNGYLLFCLTSVISPSDNSPAFSFKQPSLTPSWVLLRPYFLALAFSTWHSPGQIESSIPLEKGQGSRGANETLGLELLNKKISSLCITRLVGWKPGTAGGHPPLQGKSPPENEYNTKESWDERQRITESW